MSFVEEFTSKDYLYQCTDLQQLKESTSEKKIAAYIGFDCTAKSLHVGHLMQIMTLRLLQKHGHKPIILIGGATSKVGDPTDKNEMRRILSAEELDANIAGVKRSLSKFINFGDGPNDAIILNNANWIEKLGYLEFLRDYGKHISVNKMLSMESAKLRLKNELNLSFLEFNYMLLQAFDYYYLNKNHDCYLQIGGSDQWGNIIMGVELIRKLSGNNVLGLTTKLITTSSGAKMGKSLGGAVWLNEDMLKPYDYFQFWRNIEDPDVLRFAKLFSNWDDNKIHEYSNAVDSNINEAKVELAHHLTSLCHGEKAADEAKSTAHKLFVEGNLSDNLPTYQLSAEELADGILLSEIITKHNLTKSKSEARKLIKGGGIRIDDVKIDDERYSLNKSIFAKNDKIKLSIGKKKHVILSL